MKWVCGREASTWNECVGGGFYLKWMCGRRLLLEMNVWEGGFYLKWMCGRRLLLEMNVWEGGFYILEMNVWELGCEWLQVRRQGGRGGRLTPPFRARSWCEPRSLRAFRARSGWAIIAPPATGPKAHANEAMRRKRGWAAMLSSILRRSVFSAPKTPPRN